MSPTEKELRAFLREGEGDVPDAVSVMSNAMRVREARRKRMTTVLTSAAAAVVVIGGSVLLVNTGRSNDDAGNGNTGGGLAQSANGGTTSTEAAANGGADFEDRRSASSKLAPKANTSQRYSAMMGLPMCPATPTHYALPGGGGLNSFGANGKMWKRTPNAMRICAYTGSTSPVSRLAYGDQVAAIAQDVETASVTSVVGPPCPTDTPSTTGGTIEIYALDANRKPLKAVVFDVPACGAVHATNGTASRYLTKLPSELASAVAKVERRASPHR